MNIGFLDTECSPEFNATYGKHHEASVLHTERYQYLFCYALRINDGKTKVVALPDFKLYKREKFNDRELCKQLLKDLSGLDLIVCHNARFDMGMATERFIYHKLKPMKPIKTFCTLNWARNHLKLNNNSLKSIALFFGITEKMETSKGLWQRIHYLHDAKAWKEMKLYNKIDTIVCSEIFKRIIAWDTKAPTLFYERGVCKNPSCGSSDISWKGWTGKKHTYVCKTCGKWGKI